MSTGLPPRASCPVNANAAAFDMFDERYVQDPYPFYQSARTAAPVFFDEELGYWVISRYDDVKKAFFDQDAFSATNALEPLTPLFDSSIQKLIAAGIPPAASMVDEDPPIHQAHRRPFTYLFTPEKVRTLEPKIRAWANEYIDRFVLRGYADLVTEFGWEIPALVAFAVIGLKDEEIARIKSFATSTVQLTWGKLDEHQQNEIVQSYCDYYAYMRNIIAHTDSADQTVIGTLKRGHAQDPEIFPESYVNNNAANFLMAAHETTTNSAANAFQTLLEHPDAWKDICNDPALIPNAVEEALRFNSSVIAWRRIAKTDVTFQNVEIPAGARLLIVSGAANRDPEIFEEPERFDVRRANANKHLSFGFGPHLCMGAGIARVEMRLFLEELTRRLPHMRLKANQTFTYGANVSFRGPQHVFVEWDPAANPIDKSEAKGVAPPRVKMGWYQRHARHSVQRGARG